MLRRSAEILAAGSVLGVALVSGCSNENGSVQPEQMFPQIPGTIAHTQDSRGVFVGVRTYASPHMNEQRSSRTEGAHVDVVCMESDGRTLIDQNVPPTADQNRGNDWYLLTATRNRQNQEWVNTSYVDIAGSTIVPLCVTLDALNHSN